MTPICEAIILRSYYKEKNSFATNMRSYGILNSFANPRAAIVTNTFTDFTIASQWFRNGFCEAIKKIAEHVLRSYFFFNSFATRNAKLIVYLIASQNSLRSYFISHSCACLFAKLFLCLTAAHVCAKLFTFHSCAHFTKLFLFDSFALLRS